MRHIFVVSGPGGVGKGTLVKRLLKLDPSIQLSTSWTSRARRDGEAEDAYVFCSREDFENKAKSGGFLEWVEFLGNYYGTPIPDETIQKDFLLEIELEGAQNVRSKLPETKIILVEPPSMEQLRKRLIGRGDSPERADERIKKGKAELAMGRKVADAIIVNDDLLLAANQLKEVIDRFRFAN